MIEQPKNDYKAYTKHIEVSSDEFAHVVEIYNFPSEFKTSDLAAVFSPFKNGGFELKWVDDTHCLGVFSSPLVGKYKQITISTSLIQLVGTYKYSFLFSC